MKWFGKIGFAETVNTNPGVWDPQIVTRQYQGDVIDMKRRLQSSDKLNDDIIIDNVISILSDPYSEKNFASIKYVEFMGAKWRVSNVKVEYPRLILTLGGVYNE